MKFSKLKLKNPYLYDYGYHITSQDKLNSILDKGLVTHPVTDLDFENYPWYVRQISKIIHYNKIPIYFLTTPSLEFLTPHFREMFYNSRHNTMILKVNIKKFNQFPDLDYLLMDPKFGFQLRKNSDYDLEIDFTVKESKFYFWEYNNTKRNEIPVKLRKWVKEYNGTIPIKEFLKNQKLAIDTIATTHTFCVAENIPAKYIEDVWVVKK